LSLRPPADRIVLAAIRQRHQAGCRGQPGPTWDNEHRCDGRSARLVVIRPSNVDSGRTTSDGYSIPAGIVVTYRVFRPNRLQVTTDRREAGGRVTTQNCTGLAQLATGSPPTLSGCKP
jgi:hypothetical protein